MTPAAWSWLLALIFSIPTAAYLTLAIAAECRAIAADRRHHDHQWTEYGNYNLCLICGDRTQQPYDQARHPAPVSRPCGIGGCGRPAAATYHAHPAGPLRICRDHGELLDRPIFELAGDFLAWEGEL